MSRIDPPTVAALRSYTSRRKPAAAVMLPVADENNAGAEPVGVDLAALREEGARARHVAALEAAQRGGGDVVAVVAVHRG